MIKILNVVLSNHIGGPQIRVLAVAEKLKKFDIETILLVPNGPGNFAKIAAKKHIKVYQIALNIPHRSIYSNIFFLLTFPFSILSIKKIIIKEDIDIIHANGLFCFHAPIAAFLLKRKVVWHLISSLYPKFIVATLMPLIILLANELIFVANNLKEYYLKYNVLKNLNYRIIYECVDLDRFDPQKINKESVSYAMKSLKLNKDDIVIGCIGNLNPAKGYSYCIKGVFLASKTIKNIKLVIVGDITDKRNLEYYKLMSLVKSLNMEHRVIFAGKRYDIPKVLLTFNIFLLPSLKEGTPLVILEAMAMGKPIIATDVGGISEQIRDMDTGILVKSKDPEEIARAITYLCTHPLETRNMSDRCRPRVETFFSLDKCVSEHKDLYENMSRLE